MEQLKTGQSPVAYALPGKIGMMLIALGGLAGWPGVGSSQVPESGAQMQAVPPAEAEDGQWTMPAKNHASTRYSGLDQNVLLAKNLTVFF